MEEEVRLEWSPIKRTTGTREVGFKISWGKKIDDSLPSLIWNNSLYHSKRCVLHPVYTANKDAVMLVIVW